MMKNRILFIAVSVSAGIFFSCSKEKNALPEAGEPVENLQGQKPGIPSLNSPKNGLLGWFQFDSNLSEKTGQLADGVPSTFGADVYTEDRNGIAKSAIKFNGRYGVNILQVPVEGSTMSVAVWVKYDSTNLNTNYFVDNMYCRPEFAQSFTDFWGIVTTPTTDGVPSGPLNEQWHHLVATYDHTTLKFYVDGVFIGSVVNPIVSGPFPAGITADFQIGYTLFAYTNTVNTVWFGSMDDLRFYDRVLSGKEVAILASM